jgi:hypothetical protein
MWVIILLLVCCTAKSRCKSIESDL